MEVPFSYREQELTRNLQSPAGWRTSHRQVRLGSGQACFQAACEAVQRWRMFDLGWVELHPQDAAIAPGASVGVLIRAFGLWWLNAARIVYTIDERETPGLPRRYGFAYGTTSDHTERGEERFLVEWRDDDSVWYDLFAFSQPAHWLARLGDPVTRRLQDRFANDSLRVMQQL